MKFVLNEYHRNVSDEELLSDMRRVMEEQNADTLTTEDYSEHGRYHVTTVCRHFGSWNEAMALCGIKLNHQLVDTDELLKDIKRVARLLGKETITSSEYGEHGIYSKNVCFRRFATWNNALEQAGLKPFDRVLNHRIDDEVILKEIERLWIKLGRQPIASDIRAGVSQYSLNTFARHFGSWRGALQVFVNYINEEPAAEYISEDKSVTGDIVSKIAANKKDTIASQTDTSYHKTSREINYRLRFKVMQRDNFKCCFCGKSPAKDPSVELHIDHILPWAKGGETVMENLQTLCSVCNLGKSDLVL